MGKEFIQSILILLISFQIQLFYVNEWNFRFGLSALRRSRSRTRSENESDLLEHLPHCSSNQHTNLSPVPYIALPIDTVLSSNLFKSRSMESIDARASDESVSLPEKELTDMIASLREVDSVSSGLHRLNVSEWINNTFQILTVVIWR